MKFNPYPFFIGWFLVDVCFLISRGSSYLEIFGCKTLAGIVLAFAIGYFTGFWKKNN